MKPKDIKIGSTYCNRGAGRTFRYVLDIGAHIPPPIWYGALEKGREDVIVKYLQRGNTCTLRLSSFASWAGKEVATKNPELPLGQ